MLNALTGTSGRAKGQMLQLYFDYLFGNITKNEMKESFRYADLDVTKVDLVQHGYLCRNCKLFVYALATGKALEAKHYGVERRDTKALTWVAHHVDIDTSWCDPWNLARLEKNENAIVYGLKTYIGKFVTKKMTFLIKSYGLHRHDIETELYCAGLWALHKKYPFFETSLHAINTVKTAIHNRGMDIIAKNTREKNQRLIRNKDGTFESVNVDVSVLNSLQAPEPFEMRYRDEREGLKSLQKVMNDRGALYISLARGEYNADFSDYIGLNNTEAAEENYDSYLRKVDRFLKVTPEERERFFGKLRRVL